MIKTIILGAMLYTTWSDSGTVTNYEYKINEIAALYISDGWRKKPTYKLKKYNFAPEMWLNTLDMWNYINNFPGPSFSKEFQTEFEITEEMLNNKEKE